MKTWISLTLSMVAAPALAGPPLPVDRTIAAMSLEEKAAQLQSDAPAIERLGLPAYEWWNEGLHGLARNGVATVFPQAIGLGATWDRDLLGKVGEVVSTEARAKFNALPRGAGTRRYEGLTIWSPNINIFRDPRWGRGQETYGEDPYLTGQLGVAFIRGLQGPDPDHPRVIATPKHLAVHSGPEAGRDGFDVDVSPRDLEDTYLPAFRAAIMTGKARSVMCAYNSINGVPACASDLLLKDHVRGAWGFDGLVVSDCDAIANITHFHFYRPDPAASAAAALRAGMDLNCGRAFAALPDAVKRGLLSEAEVDTALRRAFDARRALGIAFGADSPWSAISPAELDSPAHSALALEAARRSIVLLRNDAGLLPLRPGMKLAVVGPNADSLAALEANYHGTAAHPVTPLKGLRAAFGADRVAYAQGGALAQGVPAVIPETALRDGTAVGLKGEYFANPDLSGQPALVRADRTLDFDWNRAAPAPGLDPSGFSVRWTGMLVPPGPGDYVLRADMPRCFDCKGHDPVRLWIDGRLVIDDDGSGKAVEAALSFADAAPRAIRIELIHSGQDEGFRLQWRAPEAVQLDEAARAMTDADAIVAFVGLSPDVEGEALQISVPGFEGGDRTDIGLPEPQRALLARAKATGKPLIIVLMSGSAVALDPADYGASAYLAAWYPGQAGGTAIADTLTGANNPSGRLPVTFYRSTRDLPAFVDYRVNERTYRYFTGKPLFPFGHGRSYTSFAYDRVTPSRTSAAAGDSIDIAVRLRNSGKRAGEEVVQAYLVPPDSGEEKWWSDPQVQRRLAGFQRIALAPGKAGSLRFTIDPRAMSRVDRQGRRIVLPGTYRLFVGGGQPGDAPGLWTSFTIEGSKELPR